MDSQPTIDDYRKAQANREIAERRLERLDELRARLLERLDAADAVAEAAWRDSSHQCSAIGQALLKAGVENAALLEVQGDAIDEELVAGVEPEGMSELLAG
jgi:hypothetical protein